MIDNLLRPYIKNLRAYSAKEIPCKIKLDANESPYGFTLSTKTLAGINTNRYPDPEAKELKKNFARKWKIRTGNILHGNGSDELIYYLITAFKEPVLFPVPTFSMYGIISKALGQKTASIPLNREFDINLEKMITALKKYNPGIIFLSSPNNPTGNSFSIDKIISIIRRSEGIVLLDEAYQPFSSQESMVPLLSDYKNLVIMRSLSKIGLAALRVGFLIAHEDIIKEVNKVRLPFNVNAVSQAIALESLRNGSSIKRSIDRIVTERNKLFKELSSLEDVTAYPSEANFILFRVSDAEVVFKRLLKDSILVKNISDTIKNCLRVTIGRPEDNRAFIRSLKRIVKDLKNKKKS